MPTATYADDRPTMTGGPTLTDTWRMLPGQARRWLRGSPTDPIESAAGGPPTELQVSKPTSHDHMPFLRDIWAAPLNPQPLVRYADYLDSVGLGGAAAYYRRKAADVANGRLRPEYPDQSDELKDLD